MILLVAPGQREDALALASGLRDHEYDVSYGPHAEPGNRYDFDRRPHLLLYRRTKPEGWIQVDGRDAVEPAAPVFPAVVHLVDQASEEERIAALEGGVDDVVVLPMSIRELAARLRAVIRRSHPAARRSLLTFEDIVLDRATRRAIPAGKPVVLTTKEFLITHEPQPV